jgi:heme/copper-type cytochrome/quinol oxidase subunit 2
MWDVLVTLLLMGFGALMVIVIGAMFIAAIFYVQNGGQDD